MLGRVHSKQATWIYFIFPDIESAPRKDYSNHGIMTQIIRCIIFWSVLWIMTGEMVLVYTIRSDIRSIKTDQMVPVFIIGGVCRLRECAHKNTMVPVITKCVEYLWAPQIKCFPYFFSFSIFDWRVSCKAARLSNSDRINIFYNFFFLKESFRNR